MRRPLDTSASPPPHDAVPADAPHWRREAYIPLTVAHLREQLRALADNHPQRRQRFDQLAEQIEQHAHHDVRRRGLALQQAYRQFDADCEQAEAAEPLDPAARSATTDQAETFFKLLEQLAQTAAYQRLDQTEIAQALHKSTEWGVNVDVNFDLFEQLAVFARGDVVGRRARRNWRSYYRLEEVEVPIYRRLIVAYRLWPHRRVAFHADLNSIYLKLFKNVPKLDLEMTLPGTNVRFTLIDQGKILAPTLAGLALVLFKIVKGILVVAFAGLYGMLALLGLLGGTIGYGVKTFLGYLRTRDRYRLNLASSLYYQKLGSNHLVLLQLAEDAQRQESCEALLAVWLLLAADGQPRTADQLTTAGRALLEQLTHTPINFHAAPTLTRLADWRITHQPTADTHQLATLTSHP